MCRRSYLPRTFRRSQFKCCNVHLSCIKHKFFLQQVTFFLSQGQLSLYAYVEYTQESKKERQNVLISGRSQLVYSRFTLPSLAQYNDANSSKLKMFKSTFFLYQEVIPHHVYQLLQTQGSLYSLSVSRFHVPKSALEHYTIEPSFSLIIFKYLFVFLIWKSFCAYLSAQLKPRWSSQQ